jgi:hypothetical protein
MRCGKITFAGKRAPTVDPGNTDGLRCTQNQSIRATSTAFGVREIR